MELDIYNGCEEVEMNIHVDLSCPCEMKTLRKISLNDWCVVVKFKERCDENKEQALQN